MLTLSVTPLGSLHSVAQLSFAETLYFLYLIIYEILGLLWACLRVERGERVLLLLVSRCLLLYSYIMVLWLSHMLVYAAIYNVLQT